jgi:N-terminal domain of reverse transcriptase
MLNYKKSEEHVEKLLSRIRVAKERGQVKKLRHWACVYLDSFAPKLVAVQRVNLRRKIKNRLDQASVRMIAAGLDPRKGTDEVVLVHQKLKSNDPKLYRTYMAFGIENRALQYLALRLLEQIADVTPYQYTVRGGIHAAIKQVAKVMSTGPVWAVELDVVDCYPSFDGKKLTDLLPLPKEVSERVLISAHLNLKGGNIRVGKVKGVKKGNGVKGVKGMGKMGLFGPAGASKASKLEEVLAAARQGIPQGSATSSLIAEISLLMAKEESDVVSMLKALEAAFKSHPVGLLTPKLKVFHPGQPIEFLGHRLIPQAGGKVRIEPSEKNRDKFQATMGRRLKRLKYEKLSANARLEAQRKAKRSVQSWTGAFQLCNDMAHYEQYWLKKIDSVSPVLT